MTDLADKVSLWLQEQGFPLEFKVAQVFSNYGFKIDQGAHVPDPNEGVLREIDVIASINHTTNGRTLQFSVVTECKWSRERPWVIFTSRAARPTPAASIAYLLGSPLSEAALFYLSGESDVADVHRDVVPSRVGFGGRQALVQKQDRELFYPTIQGVVGAATALLREGHQRVTPTLDAVREFRIVIPTIVIDGTLFEAFLDGESLKVEPIAQGMIAWRGYGTRRTPAFVNIVTVDVIEEYAEKMANYGAFLLYRAAPLVKHIAKAAVSRDARDLPTSHYRPSQQIIVPWLLSGMVDEPVPGPA